MLQVLRRDANEVAAAEKHWSLHEVLLEVSTHESLTCVRGSYDLLQWAGRVPPFVHLMIIKAKESASHLTSLFDKEQRVLQVSRSGFASRPRP